jgi:hypothetical protein
MNEHRTKRKKKHTNQRNWMTRKHHNNVVHIFVWFWCQRARPHRTNFQAWGGDVEEEKEKLRKTCNTRTKGKPKKATHKVQWLPREETLHRRPTLLRRSVSSRVPSRGRDDYICEDKLQLLSMENPRHNEQRGKKIITKIRVKDREDKPSAKQ